MLLKLLKLNKNIRLLVLSQFISGLGTWLAYIAIPLFALKLTGAGLAVSLVLILRVLPATFLSPFIGVIIDRINRKYVMIFADILRGIIFVVYPFINTIIWIYFLTFIETVGGLFFGPARTAIVPNIIEEEGELVSANSALKIVSSSTMLLGPLIGTGLMTTIGIKWAFWLNALSFFTSAFLLIFMNVKFTKKSSKEISDKSIRKWTIFANDIKVALKVLKEIPKLLLIMIVGGLSTAGYGLINVLLPIFASRQFELTGAYGLIMSGLGLGILVGSALTPGLSRRLTFIILFFLGLIVSGFMHITFILSTSIVFAILFIAIQGISDAIQQVSYTSLLQTLVKDELRGRISSFYETVSSVPLLIGLLGGGALADLWGTRVVGLIAGIEIIIIGFIGFFMAVKISESNVILKRKEEI
ncbi:hypothetical protein BBF96_07655 [Anoxybacter fermentans]|uniref:Major facilitator superfamily (MFS) profile domain-containing protein n=1 Tax=Anoxybacter fermentans TaxID=1323375 RepID=A0A3S9SYA0_9FIRM|nr:MFS transporter [Anoxybacter fermentans]AZR73271.1 hypothetical protein BBF96_07655 [Anoxybacter fermentans]